MKGIQENIVGITGIEALDSRDLAVLKRAMGYPHRAPEGSFVLHFSTETAPEQTEPIAPGACTVRPSALFAVIEGKKVPLYDVTVQTAGGTIAKEGLFPVLAYGSNRAPASLNRSFGHMSRHGPLDGDNTVILTECVMPDYTVVWAACISATGSIPATLQYEKGAESTLSIMWANTDQLVRTNLRERNNYALERLLGAEARLEDGTVIREPLAYLSHFGALDFGTGPAAVDSVESTTRFEKVPQAMALAYARVFLGGDHV